jgi:hypothetical protein
LAANQPVTGLAASLKTHSDAVAVVIILIPALLAILGYLVNSNLLLFVAFGSLGGIIHDLLQNKGLLAYPKPTEEGIYLGIGLGTLLGGVSGFLAFATVTSTSTLDAKLLVTPLTWGLGLKGLTEGAMNQPTNKLVAK